MALRTQWSYLNKIKLADYKISTASPHNASRKIWTKIRFFFLLRLVFSTKNTINQIIYFFIYSFKMQTTSIKTIYQSYESLIGSKIIVNGRVRSLRDSKTFGFIELNDGSYLKNLQIVFEQELENFNEVVKYGTGSSLQIEGDLIKSEWAKQAFELKATKITLLGAADETFPLQKKRHSFEYLRTIAHLRPRTNTFSAVFRVRSLLLTKEVSSEYIRQLSRQVMLKELEKCSKSQL